MRLKHDGLRTALGILLEHRFLDVYARLRPEGAPSESGGISLGDRGIRRGCEALVPEPAGNRLVIGSFRRHVARAQESIADGTRHHVGTSAPR